MESICVEKIFPETRFGGYHIVNETITFRLRVNSLLKPTDTILDVGCGRCEYEKYPVALCRDLRIFWGKVQDVIGLGLDPAAPDNPFLDAFSLPKNPDASWPILDHTADLIVSDWTLVLIVNPNAGLSL